MFVKGKSGNPGGRPKLDPKIKDLFSKRVPQALRAIDAAFKDEDIEVRLKAATIVLDRAYGRPAQAVDLGDGTTTALTAILQVISDK